MAIKDPSLEKRLKAHRASLQLSDDQLLLEKKLSDLIMIEVERNSRMPKHLDFFLSLFAGVVTTLGTYGFFHYLELQ